MRPSGYFLVFAESVKCNRSVMNLSPQDFFAANSQAIARFVDDACYATSFGRQWQMFPKTQLDSYSNLNISATRLRRCLGEELWQNLSGKTVLEVGAGAGRFTEILLERGAKVISVDLSSAVEVNAANFAPGPNHAVVQADVLSLPFKQNLFDLVVCLGVIQHTPDPEQTIAKLAQQVRPGGWLVLDHYRFTPAALSLRPLYRSILKRLPPDAAFQLIALAARFFLPLHRWTRDLKPLSVVLNRVSPMITYYQAFPTLSEEAQRQWALLDTFDGLTDWYKHFRNCAQIKSYLEKLNLHEIQVEKGGNGVEARARCGADTSINSRMA